MPRTIPLDARRMSVRLGLGPLIDPKPCMGYYNACVCDACLTREGPRLLEGGCTCDGGYVGDCEHCVAERAAIVAAKRQPLQPRDDLTEPAAVRFARPDLLAA